MASPKKATSVEVAEFPITEILPDDKNLNLGTERGDYQLGRSMQERGAGRSILIDKNGRIIAGNKTYRKYGELGNEDVIVVRTDGKKLVAVQRTDIDLDSEEGRKLALDDNRVAEVNLNWDPAMMQELNQAGQIDLDEWFQPAEIDAIFSIMEEMAADYGPVTDDDINEAEERLGNQFNSSGIKTQRLLCPHCGEEFEYSP